MNQDTYLHKGLRKRMVEKLVEAGISDKRVLDAMNQVPRHLFIGRDSVFDETAYENKAFQIGNGQTISMPFTVAYQTELLEIAKDDKVLEIGTGSGYQAAVLAQMGAKVFSIERQKLLFDRTPLLLRELGYNTIKTFFGDGFLGVPAFAPYDKIIITAAAPEIPGKLLQQLVIGGQMVIPLEDGEKAIMRRITKTDEDTFEEEQFIDCAFVPMLKGKKY
jgi:protein-L-isoaspartate(D-aspartate) O-methyltransferase